MKEVDGLLPAGWIIGNTEPKTDAYYRQSRAKSLGHAAWLLATAQDPRCRDPRQAVELAKEAAGLDAPNNVRALDTLAAACASAGDFESALRWQSLALRYAAESNPSEQEELLERYKLYEKHQPYVRDSGGGPDAEDTVFCIANQEGFDSWVLGQRDKLEKLALSLEEFSRTPEEKVVTQAELGKLREQQSQMELDGELALNKLRKNLAASTVASRAVSENEGYAPVGQMDGIATVSEKIWRKPADAPERGSLKTVASHPAWPGTKPKIDREGSVELYCIQRFLVPSPDGSSLDTDKMSVARGFSQASAQFLGLHLP
jgi:hypothetical protein